MTTNTIIQPERWGEDHLSEFQSIAYKNELATFANAPQWQEALLDVATALKKCTLYAIEQVPKTNEPSALLLFLTANNQYLASARSASAGHCLPVYPTGRATVESALYGWYLSTNLEDAQLWNSKPAENEARKEWGKKFRFSSLAGKLKTFDEGLAEWAKYLHQVAIDFGAHPNKDALYSNMELYEDKDKAHINVLFLHPLNQFSIGTMKFTVETGMFAIRLFALGFPDGSRALNLDQDIDRLTKKLVHLQEVTKFEQLK